MTELHDRKVSVSLMRVNLPNNDADKGGDIQRSFLCPLTNPRNILVRRCVLNGVVKIRAIGQTAILRLLAMSHFERAARSIGIHNDSVDCWAV
jgi:hypothetical protein